MPAKDDARSARHERSADRPKSAAPSNDELIEWLGEVEHDPLGFVLGAYPWGEPGTELEKWPGPDDWQRERLEEIGKALREQASKPLEEWLPVLLATASGHGIGKSALVCWLIQWAMATREDTRGVVTANTDTQLRTKTWPELAKWHRLSITREMFQFTATAYYSREPGRDKTWRVDAIPWSESNPEAFAGLHNEGKRILVIFDEASAIADIIWETVMGALTDVGTEIVFCAFSNPTLNTGYFRSCFGKRRNSWSTRQIDSRTVKITNKTLLNRWVEEEGQDSDFVKVRVLGQFPAASSMQFIPTDRVEAAQARLILPADHAFSPLVMGVDIARFGDDETVIAFRRGIDAKSIAWQRVRKMDTVQVEALIAQAIRMYQPDGVFIDEGSFGAGVIDHLKDAGFKVRGVNFGGSPPDKLDSDDEAFKTANMRAFMWAKMRAWLKTGAIPTEERLHDDLVGVEYRFHGKDQEVILEPKERMKERGLASPDWGDALALTFAYPVAMQHFRRERPGVAEGAGEVW